MIALNIECVCGRSFSYDANPVNGRINTTVTCPTCGSDRTDDANAVLSAQLPRKIVPRPADVPVTALERANGILERSQAEIEARAKVSWGDSREDVLKYLLFQRYTIEDANELLSVLYDDRAKVVRATGIRKIVIGIGLICVPIIALLIMLKIGFIFMKLLAFPVMVGLYGCWQVITGIVAVIAPRMESGDVAEQ
jgi:hypothetical protein